MFFRIDFAYPAKNATFAPNMKKLLLLFICAALMGCHEDLRDRAAREAHDFTRKNCPQRMADGLQLDSMAFEREDSTLHFYYSVSGMADSLELFSEKSKELRVALLQGIRDDVKMITFKEAGFNYELTFLSAKRPEQVLYKVRYTKKDY